MAPGFSLPDTHQCPSETTSLLPARHSKRSILAHTNITAATSTSTAIATTAPSSIPTSPSATLISPRVRLRSYLLIGLAAAIQSLRATSIHTILSRTALPAPVSLLTQFVCFTSLSLVTMHLSHVDPRRLSRSSLTLLIVRGLFSGLMMYANLIALQNLAAGTAMTLFATAPAIGSVLSLVFLRDTLSVAEVFFLCVNMAGVYLVASPFSAMASRANETGKHISTGLGLVAAGTCAFLQAANFTVVKKMGSSVHFSLNVFAIGIGCLLCFCVLADGATIEAMGAMPLGVLALVATSCMDFVPQCLINYALQFVRPGTALVVRSLNVPMAFALGFLFLRERPTVLEVVGVFLVLGSLCTVHISVRMR